jgi:hypothetical protein
MFEYGISSWHLFSMRTALGLGTLFEYGISSWHLFSPLSAGPLRRGRIEPCFGIHADKLLFEREMRGQSGFLIEMHY